MTLTLLKAKLHRIRVTEADLDYEGSLTLDPDDMEAVGVTARIAPKDTSQARIVADKRISFFIVIASF